MAQTNYTDAQIAPVLKKWYTDKKFESLLFRNSPTLRAIQKNRVGGETYNFGALYGRGGAVAGNYTTAVAGGATTSRNAQFAVPAGMLHSVFTISQKEMLSSAQTKGAFTKAIVNKMFSATEALRKTMGSATFGTGYGELGNCPAFGPTVVGSNTITVTNPAIVMGLDIGSKFRATNGALPSSALRTSVNTVTAINGLSITFDATAIETWIATDWLELEGSRDGSNNPQLPTGLGGWIPNLFDRTGGNWTTYIGTSFYGVTRSIAPDRLAGGFYKKGAENYSDALLAGIKLVRRQGGEPNMIIVNDDDYLTILGELNTKTSYMQMINTSDKNSTNAVAKGLKDISYQFSTSFLDKIYDDPFCPKGKAWILDMETVEFVGLSNAQKPLDDGIQGNNPGAPDVDSADDPELNYKLLIDDYLNVQPATATDDGPGAQVSLSVYGNFAVRNPSHCCSIVFA